MYQSTYSASALCQVRELVHNRDYESGAVAKFLQDADYWLVVYALAHKCVVVTHEIPAVTRKKIKIPNVCAGLNIRCITPYDMLQEQHARFVLQQSHLQLDA